MSEYTVAQRSKGILVSSGHNTTERITREIVTEGMEDDITDRHFRETGRRSGDVPFRADYFTSDPVGDEALVRYWGSALKEEGRFRLYRLALENCLFLVTEEDDPERSGRKRLRVARP